MKLRLAFATFSLLLFDCGGGAAKCVTGSTLACTCTDGRSGAQQCSPDGTFGACACSGTLDGGTDGGTDAGCGELSWQPLPLDFGFVRLDAGLSREVSFQNQTCGPVELTAISTASNEFTVASTTLTVPRDGGAKLLLIFKPTLPGPRAGALRFTSSLRQEQSTLALKGYGGGPELSLSDAGVAFGPVALDGGSQQKLTLSNAGARPTPPDPRANLKLGIAEMPPYVSVTPTNANTTAAEFTVAVPSSYNPAVGLEAAGAAASLELTLTFTPLSPGAKSADLTIFSNDPLKPETKVRLTGEGL